MDMGHNLLRLEDMWSGMDVQGDESTCYVMESYSWWRMNRRQVIWPVDRPRRLRELLELLGHNLSESMSMLGGEAFLDRQQRLAVVFP